MEFGAKIKYLRELRGISQEKLAEETGFTPSYVSGIETGNRDNPPLKTIQAFAKALRVRTTFLVDENAVTFEELAEATGIQLPEDVAMFIMNRDNLPYLVLAKSLEEQKIPPKYVEMAIKSIMAVMEEEK